jgi:propanediol utilization protein
MRTLLPAFVCFALLAQIVQHGAEGQTVTLVLPHALRAGETAWLELTVGPVERGAQIEVSTAAGRLLGVISPFGIRSGQPAGTYTIPLPADAFENARVSLRLSISQGGHAPRPPTAAEVRSARVKLAPAP